MPWQSDAPRLMRRLIAAVSIAIVSLPTGAVGQDGRRLATVRDFVDLSEVIDVQLSPDGRWIAYVVREAPDTLAPRSRARPALWLVPSDGGQPPRRLAGPDRAADSPQWRPDSRAVAYLASSDAGRQLFLSHVDGGEEQLSSHVTTPTRYAWSPDGSAIAFIAPAPVDSVEERRRRAGFDAVVADARTESHGLWHLTTATGTARPLFDDGTNVRAVTWSPDGERLAVVAGSAEGANLLVMNPDGANVRVLARNAGGILTRRHLLDWSPDGSTLLYALTAPPGSVGHWIGLASVDGTAVRELMRDYEGTVMRAVWLDDSRHVLAQTFQNVTSRLVRIDTADGSQTHIAEILASYPRFTATRDGSVVAWAGKSMDRPADVWLHREGAAPVRVTDLNPQLADLRLGDVRTFTWRNSQDQVEVSGVLVTPPGYQHGRAYPAVIHLHGGPHFHWGSGWLGDWHDWAQLLASRGYVVLLPNPRGSTGRSWNFASAILNDLGGPDVRDVLAGVDALVAEGIADPDRLGIGGFSYGGFLTAATITQTQRFAAAVIAAGITNFFSFALTPGLGRGWSESFFPGNILDDPDAYARRSPLAHVRNVTTPSLLLHGEEDSRIGVAQAWEFYNALRLLGVDTRLVMYPRAGHGIVERAHQIDYLERIVDWYDRYLTNGATP